MFCLRHEKCQNILDEVPRYIFCIHGGPSYHIQRSDVECHSTARSGLCHLFSLLQEPGDPSASDAQVALVLSMHAQLCTFGSRRHIHLGGSQVDPRDALLQQQFDDTQSMHSELLHRVDEQIAPTTICEI